MTSVLAGEPLRDLQPWISPGLSLGPSQIHGTGVFATVPFSVGDLIFRLGGALLTPNLRNTNAVIPSTSTAVAEQVLLSEVAQSERDLSDYLNHSCEPNIGFSDAITLVATRTIDANAEVTIDYVYCEADEAWALKTPCACKSLFCRGTVTGSDWKDPALHERFLLWASPFMKRRIHSLIQK